MYSVRERERERAGEREKERCTEIRSGREERGRQLGGWVGGGGGACGGAGESGPATPAERRQVSGCLRKSREREREGGRQTETETEAETQQVNCLRKLSEREQVIVSGNEERESR